jgi:MSHA biogenesis protein MshQ
MLIAPISRADTPVALFKSFAGNINFTGTQKTMRTNPNVDTKVGNSTIKGDPCAVVSASTAVVASLTGLPAGATVVNAQLYWAASNATPDYTVTFEGASVTAPAARQYSAVYAANNTSYSFFSGAIDVTTQVAAKGNGNYTMSGLNVDSGSNNCGAEAVLGGYQLLVIYSLSSEPFRVLNIYEGFQYVRNSELTFTLSNFKIPTPLGTGSGRIGHITWEGDDSLAGEILQYNGVDMFDSMNPLGNQFNSRSNINNDALSYGIDFDAYTVSANTIQSGQTSATTRYASGNDLVLTNAEIIAAPNVPATDLGIKMSLSATLAPSVPSSYTITVTNNGPLVSSNATVIDTFPSNLIVSTPTPGSGTGWSCSNVQQKITCIYGQALAVGATTPPLTLPATPVVGANGLVSNSATVSGTLYDYFDGNDTATSSTNIGVAPFTPTYMFTDRPCVHAQPFGSALQPCTQLAWTRQMSNQDVLGIYLTFVSNGIPVALSNSDSTVQMKFALSCHNPGSANGKRATFTAVSTALPLCNANGAVPVTGSAAWSGNAGVVFAAGTPSSKVAYKFNYPDVGRIELFASDTLSQMGSTNPFVSMPSKVILTVQAGTAASPIANPATIPAAYTNPRFIAAGSPFTMTLSAMTGGISPIIATNFGNESPPATVSVAVKAATDTNGTSFPEMVALPALAGSFSAFASGVATGSAFSFPDVGIIRVEQNQLAMLNYLSAGVINMDPVNVGRFYPDHFNTITGPPITCPTTLACPANIFGMAYAKQPFTVEVAAYTVANVGLQNYTGGFAYPVTLGPYTTAGGATVSGAAVPFGSLTMNVVAPADPSPAIAAGSFVVLPATASLAARAGVNSSMVYTFTATTATFTASSPNTTGQVSPKTVYIRASDSEGVTSLRSSAVEGGVMIVSGRMLIPNGYGSELLPLPLTLQAQYYQNGLWVGSTADTVSTLTPASDIVFANCYRLTCSALQASSTPASLTLSNSGKGIILLPKPGISGYVDITAKNPVWLPSTKTRIVYGVYRSPLIYIRELY